MKKLIVILVICLIVVGCAGPIEDVNSGSTVYSENSREYKVEYLFTHTDTSADIYKFVDGDTVCYLADGYYEVSISCK